MFDKTGAMQFLQKLSKTVPNVCKGVRFRPRQCQVSHTIIEKSN